MEKRLENPSLLTVHVVDDDAAVRDSTRALLEACAFQVRDYGSAEDFLVATNNGVSITGCILLDLHMPGMAGLTLLELLQQRNCPVPIIMVTGRSDSLLKERTRQAGVVLLDKPVDDEVLLEALNRALATSAAMRH